MKKKWERIVIIVLIAWIVLCMSVIATGKQFWDFRWTKRHERMEEQEEPSSLFVSVLGKDGEAEQMELEEYVVRVVLGEISVKYHPEALKAQAVAARTYTLYCIQSIGKHDGGAVCTDHRCCQAYCEPEKYFENGGTEQGLEKVWRAVEDTRGEVLYYNNELICATYFACSGGRTEDAAAVWGEEYPYLRSVESVDENGSCDVQKIRLSKWELQQHLGTEFSGTPEQWIGFKMDTVGGGVALIRIGARLYTGVELRKLLNLKSTSIDITVENGDMIVQTRGYGHRVGMSQHGSNVMAEAGEKYESILLHYYTDVTLKPYVP